MYKPLGKHHNYKSTVYFGDTDAAGVVYYGTYLRFLEAGRIEYLKAINYPYKTLRKTGVGLVPVHVDLRYHSPLRFEDEFIISSAVTTLTQASMTMSQSISLNDTLCCSATIKLASCDEKKFKAIKLPESLIESLKKFEQKL